MDQALTEYVAGMMANHQENFEGEGGGEGDGSSCGVGEMCTTSVVEGETVIDLNDLMANHEQPEGAVFTGEGGDDAGVGGHSQGQGNGLIENHEREVGAFIEGRGGAGVGGHSQGNYVERGVGAFTEGGGGAGAGEGHEDVGEMSTQCQGETEVMSTDSGINTQPEVGFGVEGSEVKTEFVTEEVEVATDPVTVKDEVDYPVKPPRRPKARRTKSNTNAQPQQQRVHESGQHYGSANAGLPFVDMSPKVMADGMFYCPCGLGFSVMIKSFHPHPLCGFFPPVNCYVNGMTGDVSMGMPNAMGMPNVARVAAGIPRNGNNRLQGVNGVTIKTEPAEVAVPVSVPVTAIKKEFPSVTSSTIKKEDPPETSSTAKETATRTPRPVARRSRMSTGRRTNGQSFDDTEPGHGIDTEQQRVAADGKFYCLCGSEFSSIESIKAHVKYYIEEWKFICQDCSKAFYSASFLRKHLGSVHGKEMEKGVGCMKCGGLFPTHRDMMQHKRESECCLVKNVFQNYKRPKTEEEENTENMDHFRRENE